MYSIAGGVNSRFTDVKSLKANKKSLQIRNGKTAVVRVKTRKVAKNRNLLPASYAARLRYQSSNPAIASVSSKGSVTAKKAGTCRIYISAQNGVWTSVKVTVK